MRVCIISDCDSPHVAKGLCQKHYMQRYRDGGGRIDYVIAKPVFDKLFVIYGSKAAVARELGITKQGISAITRRGKINQTTLDKALALLAKNKQPGGNIPLEVVDANLFALILRAWVVKYLADRPQSRQFTGPTAAIAFWAGISERTVSRYVNNDSENPWVDINVAERLLIPIEEENALRDGRLPVFPNPSLSMELWMTRMKERGCI